ncbi:hypothetical protein AVEN_190363-1 [Araneus ventricosus]|uniref:Mutator-like transposase domain-containing protein n=1 Tax=Araneus ventricosus TaxID=182803 RepID=A0A4Y2GQB2_ARAVE|nr:hypothetical protein AVEN_190363-1 [Araneus ventricosus]
MRYMSVLSDGDSKTYQDLLELDVYDDSMNISKEECLNHEAKRLGTGLRNKVKEWRSRCVTNGGRKEGSLKESTIFKHSNFYRKAIKESVTDVQKMKTAIFASLFHNSSTYKAPKYNKCRIGVTSWGFYQSTFPNNEEPKSHSSMKTNLSEQVLEKILTWLSNNELLGRCVSGKTQNVNQSIHSVILKNCPRETFVSKRQLELAVISALGMINFGCLNTLSAVHLSNPLSP